MFRRGTKTDRQVTLLVFIRPVILRDDKFEDLKYYSDLDLERAKQPSNLPVGQPLIM